MCLLNGSPGCPAQPPNLALVNGGSPGVQELRERRGVRPGLPVPDKPDGFCGRKATLKRNHIKCPCVAVAATRACGATTTELEAGSSVGATSSQSLTFCHRRRERDFAAVESPGANVELAKKEASCAHQCPYSYTHYCSASCSGLNPGRVE